MINNTSPDTNNIDINVDDNLKNVFLNSSQAKYTGNNYDPSGIDYPGLMDYVNQNIPYQLHQSQSAWASLGGALNQAITGEIVGGTLQGIGYLLDMPQYMNLLQGTEKEYGNWLSDFGNDIRKWSEDATPIYTDPFKEGQFAPEDWTWWMSNLPSIASTLSLMIPTGAAVKGLGMTGEALGIAAKMTNRAKWAAGGVTQAVLSRHTENLMEAAGTMEGIVEQLDGAIVGQDQALEFKKNYGVDLTPLSDGTFLIDNNTAHEVGSKAASNIYKNNWAMLLQDIPQYLLLRTPFGKSTEELSVGVAKALGSELLPTIINKGAKIGKDMLGEGFEEAYQYAVSERSRENALADAGIIQRRELGEALADYIGRGDLWTAATFGAFGAGVVQTVGKGINNAIGRVRGIESIDEARIKDIKESGNFFKAYLNTRSQLQNKGLDSAVDALDTEFLANNIIKKAQLGNIEPTINIIKGIGSMTEEEAKSINVSKEQLASIKEKNPEIIKEIKQIADLYDRNVGVHGRYFAGLIAKEQYKINKYSQEARKAESKYNEASKNWNDGDVLSQSYKDAFKIEHYEIPAYDAMLDTLEENKAYNEKKGDKDKVAFIESRIKELSEKKEQLKAEKKKLLKNRTGSERLSDNIFADKSKQQVKREGKRVAAVTSYIAPKSIEAVENNTARLAFQEAVKSSAFEANRFSDPEYQYKQSKDIKKNEKQNISDKVKNASDLTEIDNLKASAKGTSVESIVNDDIENQGNEELISNAEEFDYGQDVDYTEQFNSLLNKDNTDLSKEEVNDDEQYEDADEDLQSPEALDNGDFSENTERLLNKNLKSFDKNQNDSLVTFARDLVKSSPTALSNILTDIKTKFIDEIKKNEFLTFDSETIFDKINAIQTAKDLDDFILAVGVYPKNKNNAADAIRNIVVNVIKKYEGIAVGNAQSKQEEREDSWNAEITIENGIPENINGKEEDDLRNTQQEIVSDDRPSNAKQFLIHFFKSAKARSGKMIWGQNLASIQSESHPAFKLSKEIDLKGLEQGKYSIGDKVWFEVNFDDLGGSDASNQTIVMVSYKDGNPDNKSKDNRSVLGTVPLAKTGDLFVFRTNIFESLNKKSGIATSSITSTIQGFSAKYTRPDKRHTPLNISTAEDKETNASIGGFKLAYSHHDGRTMSWVIPNEGTSPTLMHSSTKNSGQIAMVITNPFTKEQLPIFGYVKRTNEYASESADNKKRVNEIFKKVQEIVKDANGNNDKEIVSRIKKLVIFDKKFKNRPIVKLKDNPELLKEAFDSAIFNIDAKKINTTAKIPHNLGFFSDEEMTYNEAINGFISFNISPKKYFKDISVLVDMEVIESKSEKASEPKIVDKELELQAEIEKSFAREVKEIEESIANDIESKKADQSTETFNVGKNKLLDKIKANKNNLKTKLAKEESFSFNKEKELEWFKKIFPNVPISVLTDLRSISKNGEQLWGAFKNASVFILDKSNTGTVYHEAFHVVFNLYLGENKALDVVKKYVAENGLKQPKTEEDIIAIEEMIADDFEQYMILKDSYKSKNWIQKIFDKILEILHIVTKTDTEKLFDKIRNGKYGQNKINPGIFTENVIRNKIEGINSSTQKEIVEAINQHIIFDIIPELKENGILEPKFTTAESFDFLIRNKQFGILYNTVKENFEEIYDAIDSEEQTIMKIVLDNFSKFKNLSIKGFSLYNGIKISMHSASVVQDIQDDIDNDGLVIEKEEVSLENWMTKATETSAKKNIPQQIKEYLRYLSKPGFKNALGMPAYVNFHDTFNKLLIDTAGSTSIEEMIGRIRDIYDSGVVGENYYGSNPEYKEILDKISTDKVFQAQFFNTFSKQHASFTSVVRNIRGKYLVFDSNRNGIVNTILDDWRESFTYSSEITTLNDDNSLFIDTKKVETLLSEWNDLINDHSIESLTKISDITEKLGFKIDVSTLNYAIETDNYYNLNKNLLYVFSSLNDGVNPFGDDLDNEEDAKNEISALKRIAHIVKYSKPSLFESAFINGEGSNVYAHIVPNFASTFVSRITNKKTALTEINALRRDKLLRNNIILKKLMQSMASSDLKDVFNISIFDSMKNGKDVFTHENISSADRLALSINLFHNNGNPNMAYYSAPVLSDAPNMLLFKFDKYELNDVIDEIRMLASSEYKRIVEQKNYKGKNKIKNYDTVEANYSIVPFFNGFIGDPARNEEKANELIKTFISKEFDSLKKTIEENKLIYKDNKGKIKGSLDNVLLKLDEEQLDRFLEKFIANDFLMNSSFSLLTVGDPLFYKANSKADSDRTIDYYKRAKEIYSPKFLHDLSASYTDRNGNVISVSEEKRGTSYTSVYLRDHKIKSPNLDSITEILNESEKNGFISPSQKSSILANYDQVDSINVTDAQAYITLPFYRRTMISLGRWNHNLNDVYERLIEGKGSSNDVVTIMQPLKPFSYGMLFDEVREIMVPIQHKNSEYILLPQIAKAKNDDGSFKNPELASLYDKMYDVNDPIDIVNFDSAVKVGLSKDIAATDISKISTDYFHTLNMENRGIQMETPEHFMDSINLFGSQIRKLIMADLEANGHKYYVGKDKLSKTAEELHRMYENILLADLVESYKETEKEFLDKNGNIDLRKISELLIESSRTSGQNEEYEKAVSINAKGEFNLPLFHPSIASTSQSLLNSIFRNRITKQKISGGAFIQTSSFGLSNSLKLVKNDDGGLEHAQCLLPAWAASFFEDFVGADGNIDFDLAKASLPDEIFEMVGYRIPTEDKYSMLPLKVVGFLPVEAGGSIMLPADITTISGSDFDVDKMYVMMKAFYRDKVKEVPKTTSSTIKEGVPELFESNPELANAVYEVLGFRSDEQKNSDNDTFKLEVIDRNIDEHNFNGFIINLKIDGKIVGSIQINTGNNGFNVNGELFAEVRNVSTDLSMRGKGYGKMLYALAFEELNKRGFAGFGNFGELVLDKNVFKIRESLIAEKIIYDGEESTIYRGFKENKNPLKKQKITPQQKQRAQSKFQEYVDQTGKQDIEGFKEFVENNDESPKYIYKIHKYNVDKEWNHQNKNARDNAKIDIILSVLRNNATAPQIFNPGGSHKLKFQVAEMIRSKTNETKNSNGLFSLSNRINVASLNTAGKRMVGIAANHTAHHALRQYGNLIIPPILFNGIKNATSISIKKPLEQYKFENGELVPQEISLTISKNLAEFLAAVVDNAKDPIAASINYNEITADMYSLIIASGFDVLTAAAFMNQPIIMNIVDMIRHGDTVNQAIVTANKEFNVDINKAKPSDINIKDMMAEIGSGNINTELQKKVLVAFAKYQKVSKGLNTLISASRADTKGLGATISSVEIMDSQYNSIIEKGDKFVIKNADEFLLGRAGFNFIAMFHKYGIKLPLDLLYKAKLFPYNNYFFSSIKEEIQNNMPNQAFLTEKQRNTINNHIITYMLSRFDMFDPNEREYYINTFPSDYVNYKKENSDIKNNRLIQRLKFKSLNQKRTVNSLEFVNPGSSLSSEERYDVTNAFDDLLRNDKHKDFALKLLKYSYYTSGLGFGPKGYSNFIPVKAFVTDMKDSNGISLADFMKNNMESADNMKMKEFIDQFFRNMSHDKTFVPELNEKNNYSTDESSNKIFIDPESNKNIVVEYDDILKSYKTVPYIQKNENYQNILFKFVGETEDGLVIYSKIDRLGIKGFALSYFMGAGSDFEDGFKNATVENLTDEASEEPDEFDYGSETEFSYEAFDALTNSNDNLTDKKEEECK